MSINRLLKHIFCVTKYKLGRSIELTIFWQVYEQIAGHFSSTRHKPWPKVVEFLKDVSPGSIVLDLGAGNGKNVLKRNDILQVSFFFIYN